MDLGSAVIMAHREACVIHLRPVDVIIDKKPCMLRGSRAAEDLPCLFLCTSLLIHTCLSPMVLTTRAQLDTRTHMSEEAGIDFRGWQG